MQGVLTSLLLALLLSPAGALGAPGAIVGAINDALHPLGAELNATPATPRRILEAIRRAREGAQR